MLHGIKCLKIFNSIDPEGELGQERLSIFDHVLAMPASLASVEISKIISERIEPFTKSSANDFIDNTNQDSSNEPITRRHIGIMCADRDFV